MFTYKCRELQWSDPAVIGSNIPPGDVYNHFLSSGLSGETPTDEIACIHESSTWSNVILELEISNVILAVTPEPHFAIGKHNDCFYNPEYITLLACDLFNVDTSIHCVCFFFAHYNFRKLCSSWFHRLLHNRPLLCGRILLL